MSLRRKWITTGPIGIRTGGGWHTFGSLGPMGLMARALAQGRGGGHFRLTIGGIVLHFFIGIPNRWINRFLDSHQVKASTVAPGTGTSSLRRNCKWCAGSIFFHCTQSAPKPCGVPNLHFF